MGWLRLDDHITHHVKFLRAGPSAAWLWVCCLAHCQRQLSDGFVPAEVLALLGTPTWKRDILKLVEVGLLHESEGGYQVHDYLEHNASRADVLAKRSQDAARKGGGIRPESTRNPNGGQLDSRASRARPIPSHPIPEENRAESEIEESAQERGAVPSVPVSLSSEQTNGGLRNGRSKGRYALVEDAIADRAAAFIEWYADVAYPLHRKGARYMRRDAKDFDPALMLVTTYTDDARLQQMAEVFLRTDHKFAEEGSRTIGQFAALAPWCDGRMREHRL